MRRRGRFQRGVGRRRRRRGDGGVFVCVCMRGGVGDIDVFNCVYGFKYNIKIFCHKNRALYD